MQINPSKEKRLLFMKKKIAVILTCLLLCTLFVGCKQEAALCTHQYASTMVTEATCSSTGSIKHTCSLCGFSVPQTTPALSHNFTDTVTKEATCSEEGIITSTCTLCGATEETSIPMSAHTFNLYSLTPDCCIVCNQTLPGASTDPNNQWYGKNWVALGTSLSSEEQGAYVTPLAARTGLNVTQLGIPGGTASAHILKAAQTADLSSADLITIEFGVNDWADNCPLGKVGDRVPHYAELDDWNNGGDEDGTFAGACYQIFTTLQERAPQAVIIFLTDSTGQETENSANCSRRSRNYYDLRQFDYAEIAMATARFTGIRVIDAGSMSMINQDHPEYLKDQIHHSELGGQQYALTVWSELKDIPPLLKAE